MVKPMRQRPSRPISTKPSEIRTRFDRGNSDDFMPDIDINADLQIDLNNLHLECQKHAELAERWGKVNALAQKALKLAEERVKTVRSILLKEAKELGISAADLREAFYRLDERYQEAKVDWIDADYDANVANTASFSMQARKSMLEQEVKLHGQQYFSTPEIKSEDIAKAARMFEEQKLKEVEDRIRLRTQRK
jgi:hypothetical protein